MAVSNGESVTQAAVRRCQSTSWRRRSSRLLAKPENFVINTLASFGCCVHRETPRIAWQLWIYGRRLAVCVTTGLGVAHPGHYSMTIKAPPETPGGALFKLNTSSPTTTPPSSKDATDNSEANPLWARAA